ncbi:60S ribosomal protein l24 [Phtheirospermum japonicum]|uniref:60S ribosomal protein l24 n=1 Tax=Phtheirospermum japonicum TaxID=374723 RepID=A0A830CLE3_9LAMI|nr:60S ribosomal protein l24 [Phtheirospermum japonicum]
MVLKTEFCRFSGAKIYPGRGIRFICADSQVFLFANSKCKRYFHNRLRPAKLTWTAMYRKQHKKDAAAEFVKKRRRATKKPYSRSIVGATLEVIQKRRAGKPKFVMLLYVISRRGSRKPRMRRKLKRQNRFPSRRPTRVMCPRVLS